MTRSISIRQSLQNNLVLVIFLLGISILAVTYMGSRTAMRTVSSLMITQSFEQTELKLKQFFDPVISALSLSRSWGEQGVFDIHDPDHLNILFMPLLEQNPQVSSMLLADTNGNEFMLQKTKTGWVNRITDQSTKRNRSRWIEWNRDKEQTVNEWRIFDYDPSTRPWFTGALEILSRKDQAGSAPESSKIYWTQPYTFFSTKDSGITASTSFVGKDGQRFVVGFDVLLNNISAFTTNLKVSEHGMIVVLTQTNHIIGLPRDRLYNTEAKRKSALLKTPEELGVTLAIDAASTFRGRPPSAQGPVRFVSEGLAWWGEARTLALLSTQPLITVVLIPEDDLVSEIITIRYWILGLTCLALLWALWRARILTLRFSRPIEALVRNSNRIRQGDLSAHSKIDSSITEVQSLAMAHEEMRIGLASLTKLEGDLQLARQIQQNTFPERLPKLSRYELSAWSIPAEETGGDTYDIIPFSHNAENNMVTFTENDPSSVSLLLADATGHGIGPALSVSQVRAMLRMAIRNGTDLSHIVCYMNDQLCHDLHAGRFITAFLGELSTQHDRIDWISAGQAPILHFKNSGNDCTVLDATQAPLGVLESTPPPSPVTTDIKPGDIFVILSDGIFEAKCENGTTFGLDRIVHIVKEHATESTENIMDEIRSQLTAHLGSHPANDDQTAIILKRVY